MFVCERLAMLQGATVTYPICQTINIYHILLGAIKQPLNALSVHITLSFVGGVLIKAEPYSGHSTMVLRSV
jgi:hypothetical protein